MKKAIIKHFLSLFIVVGLMTPVLSVLAADSLLGIVNEGGLTEIGQGTYGTTNPTDVRVVAMNVVKKLLGFVGITLICIIIYAGFLWTTSGGDAKKVETAKDWIQNSVIGLIIIFSSYQVANFVLDCVIKAVDSAGPSIWGGLCN